MKTSFLLRRVLAHVAMLLSVVLSREISAATPEISAVLDTVAFDNSQLPAGWQTAPTTTGNRDFTGARMNVHPTDSIHYITRTVSVPATATKLTLVYRANMVATNEGGENAATVTFADGSSYKLSHGFGTSVHGGAWLAGAARMRSAFQALADVSSWRSSGTHMCGVTMHQTSED